MFKKRIVYEDFDGKMREEDFYFNLTRTELSKLELSMNGGLTALLEKIVQEEDNEKIIHYFDEIILRSYGEKSLDGKHFIKNNKVRERFMNSAAYDELFMEFFTDAKKAAEFINSIMPPEARKGLKENAVAVSEVQEAAPANS